MKSKFNIVKASFLLVAMFAIASCNNEPEISNISRITFFPTFNYAGGDLTLIPCMSDFEVPPVTATEAGVELPLNVEVSGIFGSVPSVDINKPDHYIETSSAVNQDGFAGELVRTFWVACTGDLVNSIEGLYTSTVSRNSPTPRYFDMEYILIRKVGANQYEISNADGGWYQFGRLLGPAYASPGAIVTANDISTNNFTFGPPVEVRTFGGPIVLTSMTVDPATKTIVFTSDWVTPPPTTNYTFTATLTQVAL